MSMDSQRRNPRRTSSTIAETFYVFLAWPFRAVCQCWTARRLFSFRWSPRCQRDFIMQQQVRSEAPPLWRSGLVLVLCS
eukprot:21231_4